METNKTLLVNKANLFECSIGSTDAPMIVDDEVLFKINNFSFTSNNITYGVVGDKIGYWNFFPADNPNGIIPVWGFAEVSASNNPDFEIGELFYGYWPMSTYLKVKPININLYGFVDGTAHRSKLPPIYNFYTKMPQAISKIDMGYHSIIKPLFTTAFLNYGFLQEMDFFNASQIILTSASSKTALGIAYMLFANRQAHGKKIIGLTSQRNLGFVRDTGFYDEQISYDTFDKALSELPSVIIDLAGNTSLLSDLHEKLKDKLKFVSLIGLTDWKSLGDMKTIPNSKFFFAPDHATGLFTKIGPEKANQLINEAQEKFTKHVSNWMELEFIDFEKEIKPLYLDMLNGKIKPSKGYIVTLKQDL